VNKIDTIVDTITDWDRVRESIVCEPSKLLKEAHSRRLAFKGIDEKMVQDIKGEGGPRTRCTGRKQLCFEQM
jgi:hypothetical protein